MASGLVNTAFILFPSGAFGGAEKRFTNLFLYLRKSYPGNFHFIINSLMDFHLKRSFAEITRENIHIVDTGGQIPDIKDVNIPLKFNDSIPDPLETDKQTSLARKYYWFYKNKFRQKKLFNRIEQIRQDKNIKVLIGIFAGGPPLVFYKENNYPGIKIIFSDMDSWFSDVLPDAKKLWYRKYYSFNYILESADMVDFLSPYVAEGIEKLNVNIAGSKIATAPCSFIDYSRCAAGEKSGVEVAFSARLEPDKNPMLYLEAAIEVLRDFPNVKFHLLGEGSLVNTINDFISRNNLQSNVNFRFHSNPPGIFSHTSVFVSLQSGTNYPSQSVLEAMACGNAVIASDTGDTRLFINSSNGILVGLNKESVAGAIKKMIAGPALAKKMGEEGSKFARTNHTIERVSEYYLNLIKDVSKEINE